MRKFLMILFIYTYILAGFTASGQRTLGQLDILVYSGGTTYNMEMLKELNQFIEKSLPFELITVNNFDPGFYFGASIQSRLIHRFSVGGVFQYFTTGSRIGQKDYSGSYTFDQIAKCYLAGIRTEFSILDHKWFNLSASLTTGMLFTELEISESTSLFENKNLTNEPLSASSAAIYPVVNFSVPVTRRFIWLLSGGRMFDTGGNLHLQDNKDAMLKVNNKVCKTGWSGWSISTGLKFIIIK